MKIVAGLGSVDDYITLAEAGADEFFCGYVPFAWNQKYGVTAPLNRREVLFYNVQIGARSDLQILKSMVKVYGVPVEIAINSLCYVPEQYPVIGSIMEECIQEGFDVFIIADPGLLLYIRENAIPCRIHLSGETAEVNRPMMELFREFSISRFIFHRKSSIEDMARCIQGQQGKSLEYEAFALNEACHFTGAYCNSLHCDELTHLCKVPYEIGYRKKEQARDGRKVWKEQKFAELPVNEDGYLTGSTGCGLCALKELELAGITHLKIVGRGNHTVFMERDIRQMKRALQIGEESRTIEEYRQKVKKELFTGSCSNVCYYR